MPESVVRIAEAARTA